jgi:hypothetical protein
MTVPTGGKWNKDFTHCGIDFVTTCPTHPEQYDAFIDGEKVGYLRLRHGYFYTACPACGGEKVLEAEPKGDGYFEDDEREHYLTLAAKAIHEWKAKQNETA